MTDQYTFEDQEDLPLLRTAWEGLLAEFQQTVSPSHYDRFLSLLTPTGIQGTQALFSAPGQFVVVWVMDRYADQISEKLSAALGRELTIQIAVQTREKPASPVVSATVATVPAAVEVGSFTPAHKYRFDTFVVGQSNRMAFAGAKAVSAAPGTKYNPLFIYGASGLGKTHLMHAIASEILRREPGFVLKYISGQQFLEEFVYALQNGQIDKFRASQRNVGMWLLDDVQFIAGRDKTQEELFHTFNNLYATGKQIVICSDRAPRDLLLMDERLRSRFECGLVADVQMPDTETRCAILLKKAEAEGIELDQAIAMVVAESVPGNVRTLEGAFTRLVAQASLEGQPISMELASKVVEQYLQTTRVAKPTADQIMSVVGKELGIPVTEIKGKKRDASIAFARHVAIYVTRELTGDSWKHIGALFGDRDHTSVMHGYKKIRDLMTRDRDLAARVKSIMRSLDPEA